MYKIDIFGIPYLKKGSGIHIKKKNRGKFTEYCGGEVTNECILKAKKSKNPKLRKRATFALNARAWKHLVGGPINTLEYYQTLKQKASKLTGEPNDFLDSWNESRLETGNFDSQLGDGKMELLKQNRDMAPILTNPATYGKISYLRGQPMFRLKNDTDQQVADRYLTDLKNFTINTKNRLTNNKVIDDNEGAIKGEYNPASKTIYVRDGKGDILTVTHELAHASLAKELEEIIKSIVGPGHYYYDKPEEVYARLMQYRQANNIDPKKVWTMDDLKELIQNHLDFKIVSRYGLDKTLRLFNEVADNNTSSMTDIQLAKRGKKLVKRKSLISINSTGGLITKYQSPAGGIKLVGSDRSPGIILRFKEWWNNYPTDYSDGMCALDAKGNPTNDCSKYSNDVLRSEGYKAIGDAWTRVPYSGAKVLYSGYDNNIPETFDLNTYWEYLNNAADKFASKVDTTKVRDYDIVGLTSAGSPSAERAYNEGKKHGRINTHTGHIRIGEDGTRYVIHNVHNNLYQHKLSDLLGSNKVFSAVEIARPKK